MRMPRLLLAIFLTAAVLSVGAPAAVAAHAGQLRSVVKEVEPKVVKIYGAGGFRGLEAYQSGVLVSPTGHVLTVWSYVLDADEVTVVLADGRKQAAKLVGIDPRLELAVLKIEAADLPYFDLNERPVVSEGTQVLAFSNLFGVATGDEPVSVQRGIVASLTSLDARQGVFASVYHGPVYVLDAMTNNPGAAGGALTDSRGHLLGVLGKELRDARSGIWLNFALPVSELADSVAAIRSGKMLHNQDLAYKPERPLTLAMLGITLVPNVLDRTPPFVEAVSPGSPAAEGKIAPDDLVVLVDGQVVTSCTALVDLLGKLDSDAKVQLTLMHDKQLRMVELNGTEAKVPPKDDPKPAVEPPPAQQEKTPTKSLDTEQS